MWDRMLVFLFEDFYIISISFEITNNLHIFTVDIYLNEF